MDIEIYRRELASIVRRREGHRTGYVVGFGLPYSI
jgi:hypothetical protein